MYNRSFLLFWRRTLQLFVISLGSLFLWSSATYAAPPRQNPVPTPTPLSENATAARAHYKIAFPLYQNKKYDEANKEFWKVIQLEPTYDVAYRWMAQSYIDKGDPDGAIKRFESLLTTDPKNGLAYYGLAKLYREGKKDTDKAIGYAQKSIQYSPKSPWGYFLLGIIYQNDTKQPERAVELYKEALSVAPGFGLASQAILSRRFSDGNVQERLGKYQKFLKASPNDKNADIYAFLIAWTYSENDQSREISEMESFLINYPRSPLRAGAQIFIGVAYANLKNYEKAEITMKQVVQGYQSTYSNYLVIQAHVSLALLDQNRGNFHEAAQQLEFVLDTFPYFSESATGEQGYQEKIEQVLAGLRQGAGGVEKLGIEGENLLQQGDYEQALAKFTRGIELAEKSGYVLGAIESYDSAAFALIRLGDFQKALGYAIKAVRLAQQIDDKNLEASTRATVGQIYLKIGKFESALNEFDLAEKLPSNNATGRHMMVKLTVNKGIAYYALEDYENAAKEMQKAVTQLVELTAYPDMRIELGNVYRYLTDINNQKGDFEKAIEFGEKGIQIIKTTKSGIDPRTALDAYEALNDAFTGKADIQNAIRVREDQISWAQEIKFRRGEAVAYGGLARMIALEQGKYDIALEYANKELEIALEINDSRALRNAYADLSIVYYAKGDLDKTIEYEKKEIELDEKQRTRFTVEEIKLNESSNLAAIYAGFTRILVSKAFNSPSNAKAEWLEQAFSYWERGKSRTFLDQLGNERINIKRINDPELAQQEQQLRTEIQVLDQRLGAEQDKPSDQQSRDLIQTLRAKRDQKQEEYSNLLITIKVQNPEYASLITIDPLTLPQVQGLLDKETTLIEYVVFDTGIIAFLVTANDFHVTATKVSQKEMEDAVRDFRDFSTLQTDHHESLAVLYKWLITPIKSQLKTKNLIVVPHGTLHYLPFQALTNGKRYLAEDYTITYVPSASVLKFALEKRKEKADTLIAFGDPQVQGLPALRYAGQEAQSVAEIYNTQPILGNAVTKSKLEAIAVNYSIIHVAAHGEYNPISPLFSSLRLTPEGADDGRLTVQDVYGLDLAQADLVVLSACETQLGPVTRGDEVIGLSRAFIYAGTPTIIASLWNVDDEATSTLMTAFYTHLKQGMSKAEALRAAQLETRAKYPNPYYWAGIVLTGDPGKTTLAAPPQQPTTTPLQSEPTQRLDLYWIFRGVAVTLVGLGGFVLWLMRRRLGIKR